MPNPLARTARRLPFAALLLALALAPRAARSETPALVRDINTHSVWDAAPATGRDLFASGSQVFFSAGGYAGPAVTDGVRTEVLANLCPGGFLCNAPAQFLGSLGGITFFSSPAIADRDILYRTDGTRAGTSSLGATINLPGVAQTGWYALVPGLLFFESCVASPPGPSCELWRSDGTFSGTRRLAGAALLNPPQMAAVGRQVFFLAAGAGGPELWVSDGSDAGTGRVHAFPLEANPIGFAGSAGATPRLFFLARTPDGSRELWTSDGTDPGTLPLTPFATRFFAEPSPIRIIGDHAYVAADDGFHGVELWTSDGTRTGTSRLTDFASPQALRTGEAPDVVELPGRRLFSANDGSGLQVWGNNSATGSTQLLLPIVLEGTTLVQVGGRALALGRAGGGLELWATDGTKGGSTRLASLCSASPCTNGSPGLVALGGAAYFAVSDARGTTLWRSDGTAAGTRRFTDAFPVAVGDIPLTELALEGGRLFFAVHTLATSSFYPELWTSDGTTGGTRPVSGPATAGTSSFPRDFVPVSGELFFTACDDSGRQVWSSDGTAAGTVPRTSLPGPPACDGTAGPAGLTAAGSALFFWRSSQTGPGWDLYRLTESGSTALGLFLTQANLVPSLAALGGRVYFLALSPDPLFGNTVRLWEADDTGGPARPATELAAVSGPDAPPHAIAGRLFLTSPDGTGEESLWASDGTAAGTQRIAATVPRNPFPIPFAGFGGAWYLFLGNQLWRTDGTAAGTALVADLPPVPSFALVPAEPLVAGGTLYFFANTPGGRGLWRTDGTAPGTVLVRDFLRVLGNASPVLFGGRLYFVADDAIHGRELWVSDGTPAGTALVRDIVPGTVGSQPGQLTVFSGRLFFTAYDPIHGRELWESDGTEGGTRLAADLAPESASSGAAQLTVLSDRLLFSADDGLTGNELWSLGSARPAACEPSGTRLCLAGGRFAIEVAWKDFQGRTGTGHAVPLTADTGTFWFFDPANVEVIAKVLDARSLNQAFWIFYGALSNVEYTLTVTDTATGLTRRYVNPAGQLASVGDTNGFGPLGAYAAKTITAPASSPPAVSARTDAAAATGVCTPSPQRLCLQGGRFAVEAAWKDFQGKTGTGTGVPLSGDTGYFWFFAPTNVEVVAKVLDGRALGGKFWFFYGALSNVEYTLTVTDTQTGAVKTYRNPSGQFGSLADTAAF
jgi:ELWxxDGT repeat protein